MRSKLVEIRPHKDIHQNVLARLDNSQKSEMTQWCCVRQFPHAKPIKVDVSAKRAKSSSMKTMSVVHNVMSESWQCFLRHCKNCQLHWIACLINRSKLHALIACGPFQTATTHVKWCVWCELNAQRIQWMRWADVEMENGIKRECTKEKLFIF